MEKSGAKAYLVNTGWNGTGKRISIKDRKMTFFAAGAEEIGRTMF